MPFIPPMPPRDTRPDGDRGFVSLRDHFAMAALTGMCAGGQSRTFDQAASDAYEIADLMLEARKKCTTQPK